MALKFLPLFVSTLGYLGFAILMLKVRPLLAPLLWACFVTTFIYCFAILGLLELGARTALILGVVLGVIALYKQRHVGHLDRLDVCRAICGLALHNGVCRA